MLYIFIYQIYLRYVSYILSVPGVEKNIPFTLDKMHPEIRENKMSLKGPQQSTSLFLRHLQQLLAWFLMYNVLHNITVVHPTYTVQQGGRQQMEQQPIPQRTFTEAKGRNCTGIQNNDT